MNPEQVATRRRDQYLEWADWHIRRAQRAIESLSKTSDRRYRVQARRHLRLADAHTRKAHQWTAAVRALGGLS